MILNDKVYLGDTLLDLGEANGVTLEYSISDPADMAAIFTPGSWTVNLPKSAVNLQAFGFMTEPGSTTDAPHKEHPCMVIRNGVPLFDSGKLTVIDVTDTINVVITWNTNDRLTELSGRKLRDLAITKVMRWDPATFEASEDNDFKWVTETGYKQAGADGIMNYNARGFRPAVKASYLLAALLPGLTIGQTYWNRLENVWLMLPTTNGNETIDAALTYRGYGAYSNYDPVLNVRDVMRNFKQYGTIAATYDLLINQSSPSNPFSGLYIPKDGRYRIFGYIRTSSSAGGSELYNGKFRLMLNLSYDRDENGALVENYENLYYSEYPINSNNVFDVTVDLQAGDVVTIFNSYQLTNATISGDIAIDLNEVATENTDTGYLLDYPIRENLPDVGCIEFITALFSMVALQAQTSGTAVKVFSIDDVISATDAIDISSYINDRNGRQLEYSHGLTADNILSYADETDAIHFAANTYNKMVNKVVELPFASGRDMALYRRDEDGRFEFVGEDTAMALARSGTAGIRVINDHISDSTTRTVTVSVFGFGGLDWATLYGTYWQGYKGVFADNQRVVKYNAVIPESFVRTLDFSKPVHDGVNRYLLMKVSDYTYTGACTLMLALLDGVVVSGGVLENVILADVAVPLLFDVNVEALYNPSLAGTGKLIRELTETVGALPAGAEIAVDLGTGEAKKWKPTFHDHPNKPFLDLIDQGLSKTSDVVHNSVICPGAVVAGALNGIAPDDLPVATGLLYGVVKLDDVTIKLDPVTGKIYAVASGGTSVTWGTEVAGQSVELNVGSVIKSLALAGHTHSQYLTALTKAMVEAVLTGIITSHQHNYLPISGGNLTGPLTILTHTAWHAGNDGAGSGLDADLLDGQHGSFYFNRNTLFNANNVDYNAVNYEIGHGVTTQPIHTPNYTGAVNAPFSSYGQMIHFDGSSSFPFRIAFDYAGRMFFQGAGYKPNGPYNYSNGTQWFEFFHTGNSNKKTVDWYAKNLYAVNVISDGAVVAGALNGTLPDDLPVATSLLYGVIKFDPTTLALNGSNQLTVIGGGGSDVSWGTPTSQYSPLTVNSVTRNLSVDGHTHTYFEQLDLKYIQGGDANHRLELGFAGRDYVNWYEYGGLWKFIKRQGETETELFQINPNNLLYKNNTIWHEGNDGAGSGLDADLLDGFHNREITARSLVRRNFSDIDDAMSTDTDYGVSQWSGWYSSITNGISGAYNVGLSVCGVDTAKYGFQLGVTSNASSERLYYKGWSNGANTGWKGLAFLTDNVASATKLSSARTFALTGDVTGIITSDLESGVSIATTIAANSVALGTDTTGNYTASVGVSGNGLSLTGVAGEGTAFTVVSNATSNNTPNTIMFRDGTGSYIATNGIHTGAVVAGALNGTLPDDLPVATSLLYGTIKFDPNTLALNGSNQLTVIGGGWSNVAWGTATSQYTPLTVNSATRNLALDGHTHSQYLTSYINNYLTGVSGSGNGTITFTRNGLTDLTFNAAHTHSYLPLSGGNLTGALTINTNTVWHAGNDSGLFKAALSSSVDVNDYNYWQNRGGKLFNAPNAPYSYYSFLSFGEGKYQTQFNGYNNNLKFRASGDEGVDVISWRTVAFEDSNVASATKLANTRTIWGQNFNGEGNVSGALSGATTGSFSGLLSSVDLTVTNTGTNRAVITQRSIGDVPTDFMLGSNNANRWSITCRDSSSSYSLWIYNFGRTALDIFIAGSTGNVGIGTSTDSSYKLDVNGTFRTTGAAYLNSTLEVTGTSTLTGLLTANGGVTAANVISSGAVVAGALNGTLPDDFPVATGSLFGVIKTGVSLFNNVGLVNLNGRHYTTTSTYTDVAVRTITARIALGTGSMASGTLDQLQLPFAPTSTTRGLNGNAIITATGAGAGLDISFREDSGTGRYYICIYNGTGAAITRDGIYLSINCQQTI